MRKRRMSIKQAQALCRRWREKGDPVSLAKANKLQMAYRSHPEYESDAAYMLRVQGGLR